VTADRSIEPERLETLPEVFAELDRPWWIAGGWAIDLAIGRETRHHDDVDVALLADDQDALRTALRGWDLHVAQDGELTPWRRGDRIALPRFQLWGRRSGVAPWSIEILFESHDRNDWIFRRDPRIVRPVSTFGQLVGGFDVVSPEIQLLYKAKDPRPKDDADLTAVLPLLDESARAWLADAIDTVHPAHRWLDRLRSVG
jgi:hypothetical protein